MNNIDEKKVVFITGASSGIGKAAAEIFADNGHIVYGTTRKIDISKSLEREENTFMGNTYKLVYLDVCDENTINNAVNYILSKEMKIDILINNAGFGIAGSIEDLSTQEMIEQFDTNLFGVHRMCKAVLPVMRKQGAGTIINVGSMASIFTIPFQSAYSASKAALDSLSEALRMECSRFGIKICVVEPGDTKTSFTHNRIYAKNAMNDDSAYKDTMIKSVSVMEKDEINGDSPQKVAKVIAKIALSKNPPIRICIGLKYKLFAFIKRFVPDSLKILVLSRMYKVN